MQTTLNWLLWHFAVDFSLEKLVALAALGWGVWVTGGRPLSGLPGWHYLLWMVSWQPLPADLVWGPLLAAVGARQFWLALHTWTRLRERADAARWTGMVFSFFAVALLLNQPNSTGIPVYGALAYAGLAASYQLALRERTRKFVA